MFTVILICFWSKQINHILLQNITIILSNYDNEQKKQEKENDYSWQSGKVIRR